MNSDKQVYRGRFAPTPSGPLHFGSLTTAIGSYLEAKTRNGEWFVRIEDIDPPRVVEGAVDKILACLEKYGLYWDGPELYQSTHQKLFQQGLDLLHEKNMLFGCSCSRKDISMQNMPMLNSADPPRSIYPGTCRNTNRPFKNNSVRVITQDCEIEFEDRFFGAQSQHVDKEVGDFVVKRADGYFSYHLAVVIDDHEQAISHVVRGYDLIDSTFRHIYLQQLLGFAQPDYGHLPLIVDDKGVKLSKQDTHDLPLLDSEPLPLLIKAMQVLGQTVPRELHDADIDSFWQWAIQHWQPDIIPKHNNILYHTDNPQDSEDGKTPEKPLS